jgi:hypothetical protein
MLNVVVLSVMALKYQQEYEREITKFTMAEISEESIQGLMLKLILDA